MLFVLLVAVLGAVAGWPSRGLAQGARPAGPSPAAAHRPASHSDIASAETPSALASGASPPQARSASDKVCICGEGLDMRQLAAPPRFSLCGSEHRNARVDSTRSG